MISTTVCLLYCATTQLTLESYTLVRFGVNVGAAWTLVCAGEFLVYLLLNVYCRSHGGATFGALVDVLDWGLAISGIDVRSHM